jgi:hypothetical protein
MLSIGEREGERGRRPRSTEEVCLSVWLHWYLPFPMALSLIIVNLLYVVDVYKSRDFAVSVHLAMAAGVVCQMYVKQRIEHQPETE